MLREPQGQWLHGRMSSKPPKDTEVNAKNHRYESTTIEIVGKALL